MQSQRVLFLAIIVALVGFGGLAGSDTNAASHSITSPDTIGNVGAYTSLALDGAGNPVVSYFDYSHADLKVLHCDDVDCAAGGDSTTSPDTTGEVGRNTSLALDANGYPVISYTRSIGPYNMFGELDVMHCNDANCSGGDESIVAPDPEQSEGGVTSLVLDASGNPVVSYGGDSGHTLKLLHCNDANCSGSDESITSPDPASFVGSSSSLVLDAGGNPVVSYSDQANDDLKLLHCNDAGCSGGDESITSPDTAGYVGSSSSLTLDVAGNPVVGYLDLTNQDLKLIHCNDADCAGGDDSITSPDTVGFVGYFISLMLDSSGNPVMSYHEIAYSDLKTLHCNDANCAGGDESIQSPDFVRFTGEHTSLALDASGNPVVSYFDASNYDLKVLHCSDAGCSSEAADEDSDGCPNTREAVEAPGAESTGGNRDPLNPNDYFNPSHDGLNRIDDVLLVVHAYFKDDTDGNPGLPPYTVGYNPDTDRSLPMDAPHAWNLGPPNGEQRIDDVVNIMKQYYHDCP